MKLATAKLPCQSDRPGIGNHPHDPNTIDVDDDDAVMLDGIEEVERWMRIAKDKIGKDNMPQAREAIICARDILVAMGDWR